MPIRLLASFALLVCCAVPIAQARSSLELPAPVRQALHRTGVPAQHLSFLVLDAATNETIAELNADTPRSPASTIKVLTTFAALDLLGPAYTWQTHAYVDGELDGSALEGDLILVGEGDPFMTGERWWAFVQSLRERGLQRVDGDIVVDNTYFSPPDQSRADFDGQAFRPYNVLPDALMVNFQTARFTISAQSPREPAQIFVHPRPANLRIENRLRVEPGHCRPNRRVAFDTVPDAPNTLIVDGVLTAGCRDYRTTLAIMTAPDHAYGTFRTLWTESGGTIAGGLRVQKRPPDARHLLSFDSLSLGEIIRLVNKYSNNVMTRSLLLTLGANQFGPPGTQESGSNAVRAWLLDKDIDVRDFVLENGSGLSRSERATARSLVAVLDAAWHSPFMPEFAASLPIAAIDGTIRDRFRSPAMEGRLRLKTGRIDHVNALAGFVHATSGKTYIVAVILNHPKAHLGIGESVLTELIHWVVEQ